MPCSVPPRTSRWRCRHGAPPAVGDGPPRAAPPCLPFTACRFASSYLVVQPPRAKFALSCLLSARHLSGSGVEASGSRLLRTGVGLVSRYVLDLVGGSVSRHQSALSETLTVSRDERCLYQSHPTTRKGVPGVACVGSTAFEFVAVGTGSWYRTE